MAVKVDVVAVLSGSALPVDWVNVTFEPDFDELSLWPLFPLLTDGRVILCSVIPERIKKVLECNF